MKPKMARLIAFFTVLCLTVASMALFALPVSAATSDRTLYYNSSDSTLRYDDENGIPVGGEITGWTGNGNTLTLTDFVFETTNEIGLVLPADVTLQISGPLNSISCGEFSAPMLTGKSSYGIQANGSLTIIGAGAGTSLKVETAMNADVAAGIYALGDVTITAIDLTSTGRVANNQNRGIYSSGTVTITDGNVNVSAGGSPESYGIYAETAIVINTDNLWTAASEYNGGLALYSSSITGTGLTAMTTPVDGKVAAHNGKQTVTDASDIPQYKVIIGSDKGGGKDPGKDPGKGPGGTGNSDSIIFGGNADPATVAVADRQGSYDVQGKVIETGSDFIIYNIDIEWGDMKFVYSNNGSEWDPVNHVYKGGLSAPSWWIDDSLGDNLGEGYLDGINNRILVVNHSNGAINAEFAFAMLASGEFDTLYSTGLGDGKTAFNENGGDTDSVVGGFYADNAAALAGALILDAPIGKPEYNTLGSNAITLATAEGRNPDYGMALIYLNQNPGAYDTDNVKEVFFAFSGTPDEGRSDVLPVFRKVGIITVTITPYTTLDANNNSGNWMPGP